MSNALKFTPQGGRVEITLERQGGQARIAVRDAGEGIRGDFLPDVFDAFRQAFGAEWFIRRDAPNIREKWIFDDL